MMDFRTQMGLSPDQEKIKNQLANLSKPGMTNNPGGRPKTKMFRDAALEWLNADPQRKVDIINRLAEDKPDFLVQLVDGKLMETSVSLNLSVSDQSKILASQIARLLIAGNEQPQIDPSQMKQAVIEAQSVDGAS